MGFVSTFIHSTLNHELIHEARTHPLDIRLWDPPT
jgi:hypothetical protein